MKKTLRHITAVFLSLLMILSSVSFVYAQEEVTASNFTLDFNLVSSGVVSNKKTAKVIKNFEFDGMNTVFIAPTHDTAESDRITIDSATGVLAEMNIDLTKYKYIGIEYFYESRNPVNGYMMLALLANGGKLKKSQYVNAMGKLTAGKWANAYFDMSKYTKDNLNDDGVFKQFHLSPFGYTDMSKVAIDDVMYISKITFYAEKPEGMDAEIKEQNTIKVEVPAGDYVIPFRDICGSPVNNKGTATVNRKAEFDGKEVVSIVPSHATAQTTEIKIDSATTNVESYSIDVEGYKYVGIKYYYESKKPVNAAINLSFLSNGGKLKASKSQNAMTKLKVGEWTTAYFDMSVFTKNNVNAEGIFKQFHFYPFGMVPIDTVDAGDIMYIQTMTFYRELPEELEASLQQEIEDRYTDDDGNFRIPFSEVTGGPVNGKKTANVIKNASVDGRNVAIITPTHETAQATMINIDSSTTVLESMKIDLTAYKYIGIDYKYISDSPVEKPMFFSLLSNGGKLKKTAYQNAQHNLSDHVGVWTTALYDMAVFTTDNLNEGGVFKQYHVYPFGYTEMDLISPNDVMYIEDITFYREKPDITAGGEDTEDTPTVDLSMYPDAVSAKMTEYYDGIVSKRTTATLEETVIDGIECVTVTPTPEIANNTHIMVDGYRYSTAKFDLKAYKHAAILYKHESPAPLKDTKMYMTLAKNDGTTLKSDISRFSNEPVVYGEWAVATFNFEALINATLNTDSNDHNLEQIYIYPYGQTDVKNLTANDKAYIASVMFFKEKPSVKVNKSYMTGYEDSTFHPADRMTRAQACTVVARLSAGSDEAVPAFTASRYTDITANDWFAKYVAYCEAKGFLNSFGGTTFNPNSDITRAEFVSLVFAMGLSKETENGVTFNDVPETHTRYADIKASAASGLVNGYLNSDGSYSFKPDNPISRAEVVKVINTATGRNTVIENISSDVPMLFPDVDKSHWAYAEIAQASLTNCSMANGNWIGSLTKVEDLLANASKADYNATNAYLAELDKKSDDMRAKIRGTETAVNVTGTKYYVSDNGNDANDGMSPETAWKTIEKVNSAALVPGDGVFFERGDIWRGVQLMGKLGITYSAYGSGDKPKLYGSPENGAVEANWTLYHEDAATGMKIWVYNKDMLDVGTIVFNDGEKYTTKAIPSYIKGTFVQRNNTAVEFDVKQHLTEDLMIFSHVIPNGNFVSNLYGKLYLRCDAGNPGKVFDSMEFCVRLNNIELGSSSDVTIDNLCLMYAAYGIHAYDATVVSDIKQIKNLKVTNCEIGWQGGVIQQYGLAGEGMVTRCGNGVEVYGGCDNYVIDNCYVYQCYDAGVTHQRPLGGKEDTIMDNVTYSNNLIEYCIYGIEYFLNVGDTGNEKREGKNILMENNIIRYTGEGFGKQRPDGMIEGAIKGGSPNKFDNFVIRNNVFDRSTWFLVKINAEQDKYLPRMEGNTYIQYNKGIVANFGTGRGVDYDMNYLTDYYISEILKDKTAIIYYVQP